MPEVTARHPAAGCGQGNGPKPTAGRRRGERRKIYNDTKRSPPNLRTEGLAPVTPAMQPVQARQEGFQPPLKLRVRFQRAGRCSGAGAQPDLRVRIRQVQRCALGRRNLPGAIVPPVRTPLHLPPHPRERQVPPLLTCIGHNTGDMISIAAGREAVAVETWQRTPLKAQSSWKASRESEGSRPEKLH